MSAKNLPPLSPVTVGMGSAEARLLQQEESALQLAYSSAPGVQPEYSTSSVPHKGQPSLRRSETVSGPVGDFQELSLQLPSRLQAVGRHAGGGPRAGGGSPSTSRKVLLARLLAEGRNGGIGGTDNPENVVPDAYLDLTMSSRGCLSAGQLNSLSALTLTQSNGAGSGSSVVSGSHARGLIAPELNGLESGFGVALMRALGSTGGSPARGSVRSGAGSVKGRVGRGMKGDSGSVKGASSVSDVTGPSNSRGSNIIESGRVSAQLEERASGRAGMSERDETVEHPLRSSGGDGSMDPIFGAIQKVHIRKAVGRANTSAEASGAPGDMFSEGNKDSCQWSLSRGS